MLTIELVSNHPRDRMLMSYNNLCEIYTSLFKAVPTFISLNCLSYTTSSFWHGTNKNVKIAILSVFTRFARILTLSELYRIGVFLGHNKIIWHELLTKWQSSYNATRREIIHAYIRHNMSRELIRDTLEYGPPSFINTYTLIFLYERCLFETRSLFVIRHMELSELEMFMNLLARYISIYMYCLSEKDQQELVHALAECITTWPHFKELRLLIYRFGSARNIFDIMRYDKDPLGIICIYYYPDRQQRNVYWRAYKRWYAKK